MIIGCIGRNSLFFYSWSIGCRSNSFLARAFCQYFAKKNIIFNEKEFAYFAGHKTIDVIEDLSKKFEIKDKKNFYDEIMKIANNIFKTDLSSINGVRSFLKNVNKRVFIGSNSGKKRIIEGLNQSNLKHFFEEKNIFSFDMVKHPKPSPDIYLKVLEDGVILKSEVCIFSSANDIWKDIDLKPVEKFLRIISARSEALGNAELFFDYSKEDKDLEINLFREFNSSFVNGSPNIGESVSLITPISMVPSCTYYLTSRGYGPVRTNRPEFIYNQESNSWNLLKNSINCI